MINYVRKLNDKGQTLLDVTIALSIMMVVLSSVVSLGIYSISSQLAVNQQTQAIAFAQEYVDAAKYIKNKNWDSITPNTSGNAFQLSKGSTSTSIKNYVDKIAYSIVENKNVAKKQQSSDPDPVPFPGAEFEQGDYNNVESIGGANVVQIANAPNTDITTSTTPITTNCDFREEEGKDVDKLVDDNTGTNAISNGPGWIKYNLGSAQLINTYWAQTDPINLYADLQKIEVSTDNISWTNVYQAQTMIQGTPGTTVVFPVVNAQWIKVDFTAPATAWGLYESEIRLSGNYYAQTFYAFDMSDVNLSNVETITPLVKGFGYGNGSYGITVKAWNNSSGSWDEIGTNSSSFQSDVSTIWQQPALQNYVNASNKLYLLARSINTSTSAENAKVEVDYVEVKIDISNADWNLGTEKSLTVVGSLQPEQAPFSDFTRYVIISDVDADTKLLKCFVKWKPKDQPEQMIEVDTYLTRWGVP